MRDPGCWEEASQAVGVAGITSTYIQPASSQGVYMWQEVATTLQKDDLSFSGYCGVKAAPGIEAWVGGAHRRRFLWNFSSGSHSRRSIGSGFDSIALKVDNL